MKKNSKGFTLIELLIVVAIIGILSAILIPNLLSARERGRRANSEGGIKAIASSVEQFAIDTPGGTYPAALTDLSNLDPGGQPYLAGIATLRDGWGSAYVYDVADPAFQAIVGSFGRDGLVGPTGTPTTFDSDIYACMPGGQVQITGLVGDDVATCIPTP